MTNGTIEENDCPFTCVVSRAERALTEDVQRYQPFRVIKRSYNDHNAKDFDRMFWETLQRSPIAARIIIAESYDAIQGNTIYQPDEADVREGLGHMMMLTWCRVDELGQRYWEAQYSFGVGQGQAGYIRIARHDDVITDFFVISLE